ncbi:hypothetical protein LSH36_415g00023 [Paralvinella palmiformis]|uniref:Uncharacterized protein n=1 Tax=Paralvinella palmiformis TaxID=53620 RepID=A0AAD9JCN2_9ANNE|nr:hypothetical protein LSH36_415g00023 [Paralvinella palmiformis]
MSQSWSCLCGFTHLLPCFYPLYLCGTLIHRCKRDDRFLSPEIWRDLVKIV